MVIERKDFQRRSVARGKIGRDWMKKWKFVFNTTSIPQDYFQVRFGGWSKRDRYMMGYRTDVNESMAEKSQWQRSDTDIMRFWLGTISVRGGETKR